MPLCAVSKFLGRIGNPYIATLALSLSLSLNVFHSLLWKLESKPWWVSSWDLSFVNFCFWSLLPVLLLWLQPSNQNSEQAACILHKVTVPFNHQDLILAVTCLDQANANLLSDACFMYIAHGMFKGKRTLFFLLFDNSFLSNLVICR